MAESWSLWQLYCDTEEEWKYVCSQTKPTECPVDAEHDILEGSEAILQKCPHAGEHMEYVITDGHVQSTSYVTVRVLSYAGGPDSGWPIRFTAAVKTLNDVGDNGAVRIQDTTNNQTICEITGINSDEWTNVLTGVIQNLTMDAATWEIQAKTDTGNDIWVDVIYLDY